MKINKKYDIYFDNSITTEICEMLCENTEELLCNLGVDFRFNHKMFVGPCPVHGGDNSTAWNLYPEGEEVRGYWTCRTHHCEKKRNEKGRLLYGATIIGFIRGVLSNQKGKYVSHRAAVDYALKFLGYGSISEIKKRDSKITERRSYAASIKKLSLQPVQKDSGWTREKLRSMIEAPCEYYIDRGYSREILDKYDVGLYNKLKRVVVPVYDDKYRYIAGFLGRSIYDQCEKCGRWHCATQKCPKSQIEMKNTSKWINGSFESKNYLYNYWFAREHIQKKSVAILVEGAGDVWRLEESGIHCGLGLFGTQLSDSQRILLDRSGALSIICLLDPDEAGCEGSKKLKQQLGRQYRMYFPKIKDDVGGLNSDEITSDIKPFFDKVK